MEQIVNNVTLADTGIPFGSTVDSLASTAKNLLKGLRDRSKQKKAQAAADAGNYFTLRPYLKSLISIPQYVLDMVGGQGITEKAVIDLPEQSIGASKESILLQLKQLSSGTIGISAPASQTVSFVETEYLKKYLPYIIGIIIIGVIVYFLTKKSK